MLGSLVALASLPALGDEPIPPVPCSDVRDAPIWWSTRPSSRKAGSGRPADHPEWFTYHACHDHYHFREYADYRLWTRDGFWAWDKIREAEPEKTAQQVLAEHPELAQYFVAGSKAGFCVIDLTPALPNPRGTAIPPDVPAKYGSCEANQGISRGWADEYVYTLTGQWIDVTDVKPGVYIVEAEVNAEHLYVEERYSNNRAWLPAVV